MANGLINYGIIKPELATSFATGFQEAQTQGLRQRAAEQELETRKLGMELTREKLDQLRSDRQQMQNLQRQLSQRGVNADLDFVFDTMISSGIPDYVTRGLEGKTKLNEQRQFSRIMGFDMGAPTISAAPNALAGQIPPPPPPSAGPGMTPVPVAPAPAGAPMAAPMAAPAGGMPSRATTAQKINQLIALGTPTAIQAANALASQLKLEEKPPFMTVGKEGAIFDPVTRQFLTPPRAAGGAGEMEPPKLKQGERWNPRLGRVEAVEGSDIYKKQKSAFTQDYKGAASVADKMDEGIEKITEILDPKKADAFGFNFGGPLEKFAGQFIPGSVTDMRKRIDSFKSTLKSAGLELMRQGGAIGQMTVQEWPIVEQMIASIDAGMTENEARKTFNDIMNRFQRIKDRAKDVYETEYSDSQFYKPIRSLTGASTGGGAGGGTATTSRTLSSQDQQALNWANSNPTDPRAAQIKQRLGVQ